MENVAILSPATLLGTPAQLPVKTISPSHERKSAPTWKIETDEPLL